MYCNLAVPHDPLGERSLKGVNKFYKDFQFTCNKNGVYGVLFGIDSVYRYGDRQHYFSCAYFSNKKIQNCKSSGYNGIRERSGKRTSRSYYLVEIDRCYDFNRK